MKITVEWDDPEQTVLCMTYEGQWVLEEYLASIDQSVAMVRSVNHHVDVIVNAVDNAAQTPPLWGLRMWRYAVINTPPNKGITVVVPGNAGVRAFSAALNRLARPRPYGRILTADTLDQARLLIQSMRDA